MTWDRLRTHLLLIPRWRLYLYGAALCFGITYLVWLKFHKTDIKPGQVITAQPAKAVKNEPQVVDHPKQVIVYKETVKIVDKLGLPPAAPQEKVLQAVDVPRLKYGGIAATFINMTTGASRTQIKANTAPWFAFRSDLAVGAGYGIGTEGNTLAARIRYDVAQIKAITVAGEVETNYAAERNSPVEGRAMIWLEYRK